MGERKGEGKGEGGRVKLQATRVHVEDCKLVSLQT